MSDDLISRQAAIDLMCRTLHYNYEEGYAVTQMMALPSAQVERKVGKWIDEPVYKQTMDGKTWDGYTYCSECKELHEYGYRSKFCQNCGAMMESE